MTRLLIQIDLIEVTSLPGERHDFYRIRSDAWVNSLNDRTKQAHDFRQLAEQGLALLANASPERRQRLEEMHSLYAFLERELPRLVDLIKSSTPGDRAHVVGLSFGGVVAQALLSQAPDGVDHVILSGTAARPGKTFLSILKLYVNLNQPILAILPQSWTAALFTGQFGIPRQYGPMLAEDIKLVSGEAMARFVLSTYAEIMTPPQPKSPVLVVVGQRETPVAKMMARRHQKAMAGERGIIVPRGSHVWNLQQPELFNALVRAWVCDLPLPQEMKALER